MSETPNTPFDALQSRLPLPDSVGSVLIDKYREYARQNRPIYWSLGEMINEERDQLEQLMFIKEFDGKPSAQRDRISLPEDEQLWSFVEGYGKVEEITNWARMLEETNGEIYKHPEYIAVMSEPIVGKRIGGWGTTEKAAEVYLHNQKILQAVRKDPLGKELLKFQDEELEMSARRAGRDPQADGRVIGFRRAEKRYNQILSYLIGNEVIAA